ncbi:MAG: TatD family deoxyribonuclease [Clostridia bacterium]|nr:TatD family deoxyribonuclease [Clostridia bacterium]NCC42073.1 TatD family deoxyribonuclease [Clostridia bacterium]
MIFESHAHYDDKAFDEDREQLLETMQENGIERIVNVCAEVEGWDRTIELMEKYPFIYGAVGVHPDDVGALDEHAVERMHQLCRHEKMVAVGEIGLDYYWDKEKHDSQIYWFERQLQVAREEKLPFIIHSREAAKDTLDTMKRMKAGEIGGVVHCFSYGKEMAREYLDMGLYIGVGGVVTFKNARKLKEVVEYVPLESILLETDSPYLSPIPYRGKRNSSLNLPYVVDAISEIKGVSAEEVMSVTRENAYRMFSKMN